MVTINTGSAAFSNDGDIVVGKTGLYRVNGSFSELSSSSTSYNTFPSFNLGFNADNLSYTIANIEEMPRQLTSAAGFYFRIAKTFSFDVYLEALTKINFNTNINFGAGSAIVTNSISGSVSGYLISE